MIMYIRGKILDNKVAIAEENNDWKLNKETVRTFSILLVILIGLSFLSVSFYIWLSVSWRISLALYTVHSLIGGSSYCAIVIIDPIIILCNRDVHDAWNGRRKIIYICGVEF